MPDQAYIHIHIEAFKIEDDQRIIQFVQTIIVFLP